MKKIILAGILLSLAVPAPTLAAETKGILYFSAPKTAVVGQNFSVVIMADPKGQTLDTVRAAVKFSKDTLEVTSVTLASAFSVADPDSYYSNAEGLISYGGGFPGGTAQLSPFATIAFAVKKSGNGSVSFDGQSIMLSAGANILSGTGQALAFTFAEPQITQPVAQNNVQAKPKANADNGAEKLPGATAGLVEAGGIPIVGQATFGAWHYVATNKWFFLFWLLVAANVVVIFRKKIAFLKVFFVRAALLFIVAGLVFSVPAAAETASGASVYPSKENVTLTPGKGVKKSLLIVNSSNVPMALKVSVQDVKAAYQSGGNTFYKQEGGIPAAGWLFPQYEVVTVSPLNSQKMEYIVSAAKDMPGQGYAGAIVFQLYDVKNKKTAGSPFGTLINLNVLAKGITTGGIIESFNSPLVQFTDPVQFNFTVKNSSNSNLSLAGNAAFTNLFGKEVGRFNTGQLDIYPGASRNFKFEWSDAPIFGIYIGRVNLIDSMRQDNIITSWTVLVYFPWQKLAIGLLGLTILAGVIILLAKKKGLTISRASVFSTVAILGNRARAQLARLQRKS